MTSPNMTLVVIRNPAGDGWLVTPKSSSIAVDPIRTKDLAVAAAVAKLRSATGGTVEIYTADGRLQSTRNVSGVSRLSPEAPTQADVDPAEVFKQIRSEGKTIDKGLEYTSTVMEWAIALGGSGAAAAIGAWISPEVREAAGDGWPAVFFATLTWCLGCVAATVVLKKSGLMGWPLGTAVSVCFLGAGAVATGVGVGVLDIQYEPSGNSAPGPVRPAIKYATVALKTYGPLGFLLSTGIGVWLGHRLSRVVDDDFLR